MIREEKRTVYITEDGTEFTDHAEAERHDLEHGLAADLAAFIDQNAPAGDDRGSKRSATHMRNIVLQWERFRAARKPQAAAVTGEAAE